VPARTRRAMPAPGKKEATSVGQAYQRVAQISKVGVETEN
jgi:hypothetical protein